MPDTNNQTANLILASSSIYRRELFARLYNDFKCISPDVDESRLDDEKPAELALRLAISKANAIAERHPGAIVVGSDQVASLSDRVLGKPGDPETAMSQLSACSGHAVIFYTAVHVCNPEKAIAASHTDRTTVQFRNLSDGEIGSYLDAEKPWDCAGSFKSEGLGITLFDAIESRDPTALIGLPMIWLSGCLRRLGITPPALSK